MDHSSESREGALAHSPEEDKSRSGSTPSAPASLRNVTKWGREILPLSMPETVVGLTPASRASRTWVHIRRSRTSTKCLPTALCSMPFLSVLTQTTL